MKKYILSIMLLLVVFVLCAASYEAGHNDAKPIVGYGKASGVIYALNVDSNGVLQLTF